MKSHIRSPKRRSPKRWEKNYGVSKSAIKFRNFLYNDSEFSSVLHNLEEVHFLY